MNYSFILKFVSIKIVTQSTRIFLLALCTAKYIFKKPLTWKITLSGPFNYERLLFFLFSRIEFQLTDRHYLKSLLIIYALNK